MEDKKSAELGNKEEEERNRRYLTFWTDSQLYGISTEDVIQIVGMQKITGMPGYPYYVKGVASLRGEVFPLIDVRLRMGREAIDYHDRTCIILVKTKERSFGLIVDSVEEVIDIEQEQITHPPHIREAGKDDYVEGIVQLQSGQLKKERMILIVNVVKLLGKEIAGS